MDDLLWICKSASSSKLSQSSAGTEARIRRHVQLRLRLQDGGSACNDSQASYGSFARLDFRTNRESKKRLKQGVKERECRAAALPSWLSSSPWDSTELDAEEYRSLAFFRARTSQECSGWLDYAFWDTRVLQLAHYSSIVVHSLVALGAKHEAMIHRACLLESMYHRDKLDQLFQRSNHKAVKAISSPNLNYLEALVSCLVLLCLRSLERCPDAFRLLRAGCNMLEEHNRKGRKQDAGLINYEIKPIFERLRCRPCYIADPTESLRIARRMASAVDCPPAPQPVFKFHGLHQARETLQSIFDWYQETPASAMVVIPQARFLLDVWHAAVASLEPVAAESRLKKLLHAASLYGRIAIEVHDSGTEMIFDAYTSHFRTMVDLIEDVVSTSEHRFSFGIDSGGVGMLAFVGSKCRDPLIRRRSMWILFGTKGVEGDRIPSIPGYITSTLIDLEERGLPNVASCSDIPHENRYTIVEGSQFYDTQRVRLVLRSGRRREQVCELSFNGQDIEPGISQPADVIFRAGYAAYLDDMNTASYYEIRTQKFVFPMPRI